MNDWLLIAGMALVTFMIRYSLIALSGRIQLSPAMVKALSFVPPAVLTAIVVPAVLITEEQGLWIGLDNARLVGAIAAVLISLWRKNLLLTIVGSMGIFLLWQWLIEVGFPLI